jgi:hypothetical protein
MTTIKDSNDLVNYFSYLVSQADSGVKDWFGFQQQKVMGINLAYEIASRHADKMSPDDITAFVKSLNNSIFNNLIKPK